ncbi:MAG: hypothetical protein AB7R69_00485 [Candidatus Babeliales bacterium]
MMLKQLTFLLFLFSATTFVSAYNGDQGEVIVVIGTGNGGETKQTSVAP